LTDREDLRAKEHHPANLRGREVRSHARRMRSDEVLLERANVGGGDACLAERTESGVHSVDPWSGVTGIGNRIDRLAGFDDLRSRVVGEHDRPSANGNVFEIGERERSTDVDRIHDAMK